MELYNTTDAAIPLTGITLYYANGTTVASSALPNTNTQDGSWKTISLTGSIPAKTSYLILGPKQNSSGRLQITDNSGDINNANFTLSNRSFKVALIRNDKTLNVQNPFNFDGNGAKAAGYIDMVGSANEYSADGSKRDRIFGFETAPAGNSASVAARRKNLADTNNNSVDFAEIDYRPTPTGITDTRLATVRPKNLAHGTWDPFPLPPTANYTGLILNEVSGVGTDAEKFYELKNTGDKDIPLNGCKIYYNANNATGGTLPTGKGNLTWTGLASQTIEAGALFSLIGRNTPGSFTTGLTAGRILIITLEDPEGNEIDKCVRAADTGAYNYTDKSYSRIPDGTGDFYFTTPTPNVTNGTSSAGLTKLPHDPPVISDFGRNPTSVTATDTVTVSATVKTVTSTLSTVVLKWTLNGAAQSNLTMTKNGNVYSTVISAQAAGATVTYTVSATNSLDETDVTAEQSYTVVSTTVDYSKLKLNEVSGVGTDAEKFYELKNTGDKDIPLNGCKIYYNANGSAGGTLPAGEGNLTWTGLASQTIGAGGLFSLIGRDNPAGTNPGSFTTGLTAGRILIITLKDPEGNKIDECVRAEDTGVYAITDKSFSRIPDGTGNFYFTEKTPNATNGTLFAGLTRVPPKPTEALMILQANTYGNTNGGFAVSLVELYNNTNAEINLNTGNYYLHVGNATVWTYQIKLTGTVPSKCSYLIVSNTDAVISTPRAPLPTADQSAAFTLINDNFKVAVLKNQATLSVQNPFGEPTLTTDYVDMLGVGTTNGVENEAAATSRPQAPRRTSLADTDNNKADFAQVDYRSTNTANDQLYKYWPRNADVGAWNPITGLPAVHPTP